jgi:hypothetical protein
MSIMSDSPNARQLVQTAFNRARQSGKPDWWRMAIPVLKNRLLQTTNRDFREMTYGALSFRDFIQQHADMLRVEETPFPGFVVLRSAEPEHQPGLAPTSTVLDVPPDLWRATLDFSSGNKYVWDESKGVARPAADDEHRPMLPTLSAEELDALRTDFANIYPVVDEDSAKRVDVWRTKRLPTHALPPPFQPAWNRYLKRKVQDRLSSWFAENNLAEPSRKEAAASAVSPDQQLEQLRRFVIDCVRRMSRQELEELRISPALAMRAAKG